MNKYGPNTEELKALIEQIFNLSEDQVIELASAHQARRGFSYTMAWNEARNSALDAERDLSWELAWEAAHDAFLALIAKDLITEEQFNLLYGPWASVMESQP